MRGEAGSAESSNGRAQTYNRPDASTSRSKLESAIAIYLMSARAVCRGRMEAEGEAGDKCSRKLQEKGESRGRQALTEEDRI